MNITEALAKVKYVADSTGKKTDVIVPVEVWQELLASWQQLVEQLEDKEDTALFKHWLHQKESGAGQTIPLDDLERELIEDGLL
ncbi:MAG: hypothetical protein KME26_29850 [Oscillatoria princeps RMCB-10]|nr:hypothetical protein [Oscillatoria princeps RMCB-10]